MAVRALQLATQLEAADLANASYELFKVIIASEDLTEEYWEAARHVIRGAFRRSTDLPAVTPTAGESKEILKFLDHHLGLQGAGEDHTPSIMYALDALTIIVSGDRRPAPLVLEYIRGFNCARPSFVRGMRSIMRLTTNGWIREFAIRFIAIVSDQWFNSPVPIMEPVERSEFCENLATLMVGPVRPGPDTRKRFFFVLFGMLRSPEWRNHIVTRLWSLFADWTLTDEGDVSFQWCLKNAIELLEFTKGLSDGGEGFRWWYGTLWFHFEKLEPTVRGEVERIATEMSSGDDLSDLNLYLNLIGQEAERTRRTLDGLTEEARLDRSGMELRARIVRVEGNYRRLARIAGRP